MDDIKIGELSEVSSELPQPESKDQKMLLLLILVVVAIFAFSLGGFKFYDNITSAEVLDIDQLHEKNINGELNEEEGYIYNQHSFIKFDGLWWTMIKRGTILVNVPLHFGPKEVEFIEITGELKSGFNQGNQIFIAVNPTINYNKYYSLALMELSNNVAQGVDRSIASACTEENEICAERIIVNCENTQNKPVIEIVVANETPKIELMGTCIRVSGSGYNITKAVNRLLYEWYDII